MGRRRWRGAGRRRGEAGGFGGVSAGEVNRARPALETPVEARHPQAGGTFLHTIHLLSTVALRDDLLELWPSAGEVGAVVEALSPDAFEVEFIDQPGQDLRAAH
jgi:hypothetical protein